MTTIVALDPGGTTGVAGFVLGSTGQTSWSRRQLGPHVHHADLWGLLEKWCPDIVVVESFEYRNMARPGLELVSREYIGIARLWCVLRGKQYVSQMAGAGKMGSKTFVKKENIEKLGLYLPGKKHAMDATAHLLYFLIHNKEWANDHGELKRNLLQRGWK